MQKCTIDKRKNSNVNTGGLNVKKPSKAKQNKVRVDPLQGREAKKPVIFF